MSISAKFCLQKISAHFQFHLLNLRAIKQAKEIKKMKDNKSPEEGIEEQVRKLQTSE